MTQEARPPARVVDAVVLAGSINRIPLFPGDRPGRKALVEILGRPLVAYVLDALHEARTVGRILVVGAPEVVEYASRWPRVEGVMDGDSLLENATLGLEAARTERVLFCNPDQPLLRAEMVDAFVEQALDRDAELVSSWIRREDLGAFTEEGEHKLAEFADGAYAHGNLFLVRRSLPALPAVRRRLDRIYAGRKSNLRFAWALGPRLFMRFLWSRICGRLPTLDETLRIAGEHFGARLAPAICSHPEIALDIDEPEDYECALRHLSLKAPPSGELVEAA